MAVVAGKLDGYTFNNATKKITIKGEDFEVDFDPEVGTISHLSYDGETVIADGNGPKLDALRAFTNNDNWFYTSWYHINIPTNG